MKNDSINYIKVQILFGLLLIFPIFIYSQDILWEKSYGGRHAEYLMDAVPTADYGFILAGSSLSKKTGNKTDDNLGDLDYWLWKMKENGDLDWQKSFGGSGSDFLQSIKLTNDGGFILGGTSNSSNVVKGNQRNDKKEPTRGDDDFWIIKLDAGGGEQWQKTIGGSGQEKLQSISQTKDGGYIIGGSSSSEKSGDKLTDGFGNLDYWLVKIDKDGKTEWQKTYGGIYFDELRSVAQTNDHGYILGGYSNSPATGNKSDQNNGIGDYWVLKLDKKGEIIWQKTIGGDKDDQLNVVHQTYDNGFLIGGNSNSNASNNKSKANSKGTDFWVLKLDNNGEILWQETYNIGNVDILTSLVENKDHTILLGGFAKSEVDGTNKKEEKEINDYVALKITEKGDEIWRNSVGSAGEDMLKKAIETRDGGYLLVGTSNPIKSSGKGVLQTSKSKNGASKGNSPAISMGNGKPNKKLQSATDSVNESFNEATQAINEDYKEGAGKMTKSINDAIGQDKESSFKYGLNDPTNLLNNKNPLGSSGDGSNPLGGLMPNDKQKPNSPPSRDKTKNFGNNDFWVVKLRDKNKPTVVKASIEAFPNPADTFTNVIVGYEYQSGTATLVDLAGHVLQQFPISSRTIPVDLSTYPVGIYILNIKTNMGNDGIKIIKSNN